MFRKAVSTIEGYVLVKWFVLLQSQNDDNQRESRLAIFVSTTGQSVCGLCNAARELHLVTSMVP